MKVKDYMTNDVFSLREDKQVVAAHEIMSWANVRHVPVVNDHFQVVGLVSHRDLLRISLGDEANTTVIDERQHLAQLSIRDIMRTEVRCIDPEAPIHAAAHLMRTGKFGCLPVVDHKDVLLGIITEHDLLGIVEELANPVAKA